METSFLAIFQAIEIPQNLFPSIFRQWGFFGDWTLFQIISCPLQLDIETTQEEIAQNIIAFYVC
jgi:hypothetical protein